MYRTHCQRILDTVIRANFDEVKLRICSYRPDSEIVTMISPISPLFSLHYLLTSIFLPRSALFDKSQSQPVQSLNECFICLIMLLSHFFVLSSIPSISRSFVSMLLYTFKFCVLCSIHIFPVLFRFKVFFCTFGKECQRI